MGLEAKMVGTRSVSMYIYICRYTYAPPIPLPPFLGNKAFLGRDGGGGHIEALCGRTSTPPPLVYT